MDHRQDLRELGGRFKAEGELWIACMFYATWVEHTLIHLIFIGAGRTGLAENMAKQVIRETSISAKLTWLMPLFGFESISPIHVNLLLKLSEYRNNF